MLDNDATDDTDVSASVPMTVLEAVAYWIYSNGRTGTGDDLIPYLRWCQTHRLLWESLDDVD